MSGRGAGRGTVSAEFARRTTEGTRAMRGVISTGIVAAHVGFPTAEGSIAVIAMTYFGIHKAMNIDEGFLTMLEGVACVATFQTRIVVRSWSARRRCQGVRRVVHRGESSVSTYAVVTAKAQFQVWGLAGKKSNSS